MSRVSFFGADNKNRQTLGLNAASKRTVIFGTRIYFNKNTQNPLEKIFFFLKVVI